MVVANTEGVEAQWTHGINRGNTIITVDPRFSLANDYYWHSVERCAVRS